MIQELFGGSTGAVGDRKIFIPFSPTTFPSTTPILTSQSTPNPLLLNPELNNNNNNDKIAKTNTNPNPDTSQELRCPRCDSTNTKFCYYNNYNLTQPRHFCKTCRRYWTKGGTLRNVPIGGGCRKSKSATTSSAASGLSKSSTAMARAKATLSTELLVNGTQRFLGNGFLDHFHQNPISPLWSSQSSHILGLLRRANPNPNPNPAIKAEGITTLVPNPNLYPLGCFSRSNQQQLNGDIVQNGSGIMEQYQRTTLRSQPNYGFYGDENQGAVISGKVVGSSSSSLSSPSAMNSAFPLEGAAADHVLGGNYGIMSSVISNWSEFPTVPVNSAFP